MARGLNSVLLAGTLTQAPELRYTPNGLAILELNLGGNDHVIGDDGKERDLAWYHRATVFGAQAESMSNQVEVGSPVFVEGRLNYRSWENQEGQRRSSIDVTANRVEVLTFGPRNGTTTVQDSKGQHRLVDAMNRVALIGNLTRDAELRYTPSGSAVTRFSIAVNERFRDRSGNDQERTHFVDVTAWRELAEACSELGKGAPVFVTGRLVNDSWTDKDGNRRYTTRIEAERVEFMTRGPGSGQSAGQPAGGGKRSTSRGKPGLDIDEEAPRSKTDLDAEFPPEEDLPF